VRQLITESVVLAALAAVGGALLAALLLRAIAPQLDDQLGASVPGGPGGVIPNLSALALCVLASTALGVALGVLPALASRRADAAAAVRGARGAVSASGAAGVRRALIAAQLALTTALLVAAALTTRTAVALATRPLGFRVDGIAHGQFLLPRGRYPDDDARRRGAARVLAAVRAAPGVRAAALVSWPPFRPVGGEAVTPEGAGRAVRAASYRVSPGYFATLDVALLAGRALDERDDARAAPVTVVSEGVARRLWPGASALGRRVRLGEDGPWRTVVGVVRDTRKPLVSEPLPDAYVPVAQAPGPFLTVVARGDGEARALAPALQRAVGGVDDDLVLAEVAPLSDLVDRDGARPRALAALLGTFAGLALALAALALYSSLSYVVAQRGRELAVRAAVGADAGRLRRAVFGEGGRMVAAGLAAGALLSLALRRVLASQLHGVSAADPVSLAAVAAVLAAAALAAMAGPARRASRTDPARALRGE
jgi:predicted permease